MYEMASACYELLQRWRGVMKRTTREDALNYLIDYRMEPVLSVAQGEEFAVTTENAFFLDPDRGPLCDSRRWTGLGRSFVRSIPSVRRYRRDT